MILYQQERGVRIQETRIVEENIQNTLTQLGLATAQAKTYLTLTVLGKATAKQISNHSGIARQEVYRLLVELETKGLIERIIASPTEFKTIPIEQCLSILIKRKEEEISEVKKETNKILRDFKQNIAKPTIDEKETHFAVIPRKEALILKLKKMTKNTEKSIDIISGSKSFMQFSFELFDDIHNALRKDVRFRVIVDNSKNTKSSTKAVQEFTRMTPYELRILAMKTNITFLIFDKKEIIMICFWRENFAESPALWSNNPNLIEVFQNYFESMWKKAA